MERDHHNLFSGMTLSRHPAWTLILPESWDESKTDFKGEVDGFVFSFAFQDGGRDQCTS